MTVKTSQKCPCVQIWVNSQNRQLTDFDLDSNLPLKCIIGGLIFLYNNKGRTKHNLHIQSCLRIDL